MLANSFKASWMFCGLLSCSTLGTLDKGRVDEEEEEEEEEMFDGLTPRLRFRWFLSYCQRESSDTGGGGTERRISSTTSQRPKKYKRRLKLGERASEGSESLNTS
jgi:hypothetical protein